MDEAPVRRASHRQLSAIGAHLVRRGYPIECAGGLAVRMLKAAGYDLCALDVAPPKPPLALRLVSRED